MARQRNVAPSYSLRRRGLVLSVLAMLVVVEIITVAAVVTSQHIKTNAALDKHTRQLLRDVVDETRENAKGFLKQAENAARLTQRIFQVDQLALEHRNQLERYFFEQLRIVTHIDSFYFGTPEGEFLFVKRSRELPGAQFVTKIIEYDAGSKRVFHIWRDENFVEVGRREDPTDSYDPRQRPWYLGAKKTSDAHWTDPYLFFTSRQPGLTISLPVYGPGAVLEGVVGADVELSSLSVFLKNQQATKIGAAVIVHRNGDVIAYPFLEQLPRLAAQGDRLRLARLNELDAVTSGAAKALTTEHSNLSSIEEPFFGRFRSGGEWHRVVFIPFLDQTRWPWVMGVYAPEERFAGSIREGQRQSLLIALGISVLITALSFLLGPRFMRPLEDLQVQAGQDHLTGLLNRRSFMAMVMPVFEESMRTDSALCAIMIDVDRFKNVNDTYGHPVGDEILRALAGRIERGLSQTDFLARYGGEEFAIVLPDATLEQATTVAERLKKLISSQAIATDVGPISVTISLGVAKRTRETITVDELLDAADRGLLHAKRTGRNRVVATGTIAKLHQVPPASNTSTQNDSQNDS